MPTKKNAVKAVEVKAVEVKAESLTQAELDAEKAVLALAAANLQHYIDAAIMAAGMAATQAEHEAARPLSAIDKATQALAAVGVDIKSLEADKATPSGLAITFDALGRALGGKLTAYMTASESMHSNGTHLVTYYITSRLLKGQSRFSIAEVNEFANKTYTRPKGTAYMSNGHVATIKRLLGNAGFKVNSSSGFFSITA